MPSKERLFTKPSWTIKYWSKLINLAQLWRVFLTTGRSSPASVGKRSRSRCPNDERRDSNSHSGDEGQHRDDFLAVSRFQSEVRISLSLESILPLTVLICRINVCTFSNNNLLHYAIRFDQFSVASLLITKVGFFFFFFFTSICVT